MSAIMPCPLLTDNSIYRTHKLLPRGHLGSSALPLCKFPLPPGVDLRMSVLEEVVHITVPHITLSLLGVHYGGLSYAIDLSHEIADVDFGWDWSTGEFLYASNVKFHQALFLLFGRRRLAKVCPQCSACFLAKRGTQLYCSTDCSEIAEREWKHEWWRKNGEGWRAKRNRTSGKKKQSPEHPNTTAGRYLM
jgi:hypothetical protein